jgi:hypothetical protein
MVMAPTARNTFFNGTPTGPGLIHAWGTHTDLLDSAPAQTPFTVVSIETRALTRGAEILGRDNSLLAPGSYKTFSGERVQRCLRRAAVSRP